MSKTPPAVIEELIAELERTAAENAEAIAAAERCCSRADAELNEARSWSERLARRSSKRGEPEQNRVEA
jgi:hypothetical protein